LTGGVSKGDYDHVPDVIAGLGATTVFHRLPMRPGRPILGAVSASGQLILGLPGNPISAMVGMSLIGLPLLAKRSGQSNDCTRVTAMTATGDIDKTLSLHWYRLVKVMDSSTVEIIDSRGSGDLIALAKSDGFIYQPPGKSGVGPWDFYAW
jgi:molybdopterin molybdotransferase